MATRILERGDIYFAYRPRVEHEQVEGIEDVQRLFVLMQPSDSRLSRRLVVGRKRMPDPRKHERFWGFVDEVADRPEVVEEALERETYRTRTRGERAKPEARPAGEGRYALVRHDDHTHLAYELELPTKPRDVQQELDIEPQASYVIAVKNPQAGSPTAVGLSRDRKAQLPESLQERFVHAEPRRGRVRPDWCRRRC